MRFRPVRGAGVLGVTKRIISPASPEFTVCPYTKTNPTTAVGAWFSANDPLALPFVLPEAALVTQLGWVNGSDLTDNVDLGIYDTAWARKISTGGTARSGASVWQWINVADTSLDAGRYYLVMSSNGTTANCVQAASNLTALLLAFVGCQDSATDAYPLPDPLTNMADTATATRIPWCGIALGRTPF